MVLVLHEAELLLDALARVVDDAHLHLAVLHILKEEEAPFN